MVKLQLTHCNYEFQKFNMVIAVHELLSSLNSSDCSRTETNNSGSEDCKTEEKTLHNRASIPIMCSLFTRRWRCNCGSLIGGARLYHALMVVFLEYFAWGLLTVPVINILTSTFPTNKFLMNGLILGIKGILSFASAPVVGALSDKHGRRFFLLLTVFFTCLPIPFLFVSPWWYYGLFCISGLFSVTYSIVLAYVADITEPWERSSAYGFVSATFAASLIVSPALGAYVSQNWSDGAAIFLATVIASFDVIFVFFMVPESLVIRRYSMNWNIVDPFASLKFICEDRMVLQLATIVLLSYLPESGQFSCFFVYLKLVVGFSPEQVAAFIGMVGVLSVFAQTFVLSALNRYVGIPHTITLGLCFQLAQLLWYGLGTKIWMMWAAGVLAAMSQLTFPSVSAFISIQTDRDMQGTVQGVMTGIRGLCQGLGPAVFGLIFYQFGMDLSVDSDQTGHLGIAPFPAPRIRPYVLIPNLINVTKASQLDFNSRLIPGPPFLFGTSLVLLALLINSSLRKYIIISSSVRMHRRGSSLNRPSCTLENVPLIEDSAS